MNRGINAVEHADLMRLQSGTATGLQQVADHRLLQPVVLGINSDLLAAETPQHLGHQRAGTDGVLVEIQSQEITTSFQRCAVALQVFNGRTGRRGTGRREAALGLTHMRSRVAMPSSPSPSLRVSAVRRQRARRDGSASGGAFSTDSWS